MATPRDVAQAVKYLDNWQRKGVEANANLALYMVGDAEGTRLLRPDTKAWIEMGEYVDNLKAALGL